MSEQTSQVAEVNSAIEVIANYLSETKNFSITIFKNEDFIIDKTAPIQWAIKSGSFFSDKNEKPNKKFGYVYLVRASNGLFKIGKAKDVSKRIKPFGVMFPMDWELIHSFPCMNYSETEKNLHKRYAEYRKIGEWFDLPSICVSEIMATQEA